jgi:hypothetical protein
MKPNRKSQAGTIADSSTKDEDIFFSQHNAKPNVVCSQSPHSPELVFARKMYLCVQLLGGQSDILSTIGSWRDSLSDKDVFESLDSWIDDKLLEQKQSISYVEQWHKK